MALWTSSCARTSATGSSCLPFDPRNAMKRLRIRAQDRPGHALTMALKAENLEKVTSTDAKPIVAPRRRSPNELKGSGRSLFQGFSSQRAREGLHTSSSREGLECSDDVPSSAGKLGQESGQAGEIMGWTRWM